MKKLLSGNEAVAQGAYEAGVRVAAAYPGTPSTEILENLARYDAVYSEWSPNEKVALDVAIGAAYAGSRAMAVMKHVGLNVAADSFFYASMTGLEAGLVIVSADDPQIHSSQNEQDNRHYARFARVPCLEPSDSQEAKDMVAAALDISEKFDGPVMLRLTTRISHSDTIVELGERTAQEPAEPSWFPTTPGAGIPSLRNASGKYKSLPRPFLTIG
jgi:indolepyruvate ferredoxin oxidoreductase alpha subunit